MARPGSRLTHRVLAPLAGLALVGALLGACAPAPGAAAVVDGAAIGENTVATVVSELGPYFDGGLPPTQALVALISAPVYIDVASEAGLGMSDEEAERALTALNAQLGASETEFSDASLLVVRRVIMSTAMQNSPDGADLFAQVTEQLAELDVTVSPRYGSWDGQQVAAVVPDWIVQPAPEAA